MVDYSYLSLFVNAQVGPNSRTTLGLHVRKTVTMTRSHPIHHDSSASATGEHYHDSKKFRADGQL